MGNSRVFYHSLFHLFIILFVLNFSSTWSKTLVVPTDSHNNLAPYDMTHLELVLMQICLIIFFILNYIQNHKALSSFMTLFRERERERDWCQSHLFFQVLYLSYARSDVIHVMQGDGFIVDHVAIICNMYSLL